MIESSTNDLLIKYLLLAQINAKQNQEMYGVESKFDEILNQELEKGSPLNQYQGGLVRTVSIPPILHNKRYSKTDFEDIIDEVSQKYQVPSELVKAVIQVESNFDPNAVSKVGAMGLMQLMPKTAESLGVQDPFDPKENIEGGVKYLRQLLDKYQNTKLALAAYNAGPGNVDRFEGIPPFADTRQYIDKVLSKLS
ncbi:lytic transglycosylase domain-containing protein [Tepidibacillus infernus]|uniref:lytic transglycosylase domain-containing protein n=1 Tax=Tepidibacillus infernus TaxID=1806172 RepID=UPI003A3918B5